MRLASRLLPSLALALLAAGCGAVRGSGKVASKTLPAPAPFHAVRAEGALRVEVADAAEASIVVRADDNLIDLLEAEVADGTLVLRTPRSWQSVNPFVVQVGAAALDAVEADGSVKMIVQSFRGVSASVSAGGAAAVDVGEVRVTDVVAVASGAARIALAGEATGTCRVETSAAAAIDAVVLCAKADVKASGHSKVTGITTKSANVLTGGSSTVEIAVSGALHADAGGASSVIYVGDPAVTGAAAASARVRKKE